MQTQQYRSNARIINSEINSFVTISDCKVSDVKQTNLDVCFLQTVRICKSIFLTKLAYHTLFGLITPSKY